MNGKITLDNIAADLASFADLGTEPPFVVEGPEGTSVQLTRHGEPTRIELNEDGLLEYVGEQSQKHASFKALLASDRYGSLKSWAAQQTMLLRHEVESVGALIEQTGTINNSIDEVPIDRVDELLREPQPDGTTRILLIDGPAGIGKTNFIMNLALRRSENLSKDQAPLILHVESRGRQLSYIYDLVAFSLQRLRSSVTFDQIPILVRHGLITIAVDGFDELADPNGYNLAWAQVNELVRSIRGQGSLILAGRETFIGRKRVQQDIQELREGIDQIDSFTLTAPTPTDARRWLLDQAVGEAQLQQLEGLLERGSLALRPFFLKQLADPDLVSRLHEVNEGGALNFLIEAMIARESGKFGGEVDEALTTAELQQFVRTMMYEIARDMADNQTVSISEATLIWIVELAIPKPVSQAVEFLLKNRAPYLGFLTVDSRPRYLRFYHEKFLEYFLARVIVTTISRCEVPKFVARNIFGTSFLETLASVLEASPESERAAFHEGAQKLLSEARSLDRSTKNVAAFLLATLHLTSADQTINITGVEIDEARLMGNVMPAELESCVVSQLDARDADLTGLKFNNTNVFTLIVNDDTLVRDDSVNPHRLVIVRGGDEIVESEKLAISDWLLKHSLNPPEIQKTLLPAELYDNPMVRLLGRAARMRQYWLRRGDDKYSDRILSDDNWTTLSNLLEKNNLLTIETRDASGTDATFFHIKHASEILSEERSNQSVLQFYKDLEAELTA
jgi:hypothetical protein